MGILKAYSLLIIAILSLLLVIAVLYIITLRRLSNKGDGSDSDRGDLRQKFLREFRDRRDAQEQLEDYKEKYELVLSKNRELENEIHKLNLTVNELTRLYDNKAERSNTEIREDRVTANLQNSEDKPILNNVEPRNIMYASFPRSAGSTIYFSDLTDKLADDSYFELRISGEKASFRPLDFMKIRNYDPAMAVILTDGVKPNVASTVVGVEPGNACLEGNDWIIKNLAKVKLV